MRAVAVARGRILKLNNYLVFELNWWGDNDDDYDEDDVDVVDAFLTLDRLLSTPVN